MASLLLPPLIVPTSSSASSSLFSRAAFPNPTARFSAPNAVRCEMNMKPRVPVLNDQMQSKYLQRRRSEEYAVSRNSSNMIKIFSGSANNALSQEIALSMDLNLGNILINWSDDGELSTELPECVCGCDVYLVHPACLIENLLELLSMIEACRRASAENITVVITNFGNDIIDGEIQRGPDLVDTVADLIVSLGANRVVSCDMSFYPLFVPVDYVYCEHAILDYLANKKICPRDLVVVSHERNAPAIAQEFAARLSEPPLPILLDDEPKNLVRDDVKGKVVVLVDYDMIDPDGIMVSAELLHELGVCEVYACATTAFFSPPVIARLSSGLFQEVIVTDTIPVSEQDYFPQLTVVSVGYLVAETILRPNAPPTNTIF